MSSLFECLLIGPMGSGKSLLLDRLQDFLKFNNPSTCIYSKSSNTTPTMGVDVISVNIPNIDREVIFREVGASVISQWATYIKECSAIVFVIDVSDSSSTARSMALLLEVITNEDSIGILCSFSFSI